MTEKEFFETYRTQLTSYVEEQKNDLETNSPDKYENFISRSYYLSNQITEKSDLLISEIFIDNKLDMDDTRNFKGYIVNVLQYFLLGVSGIYSECRQDFQEHSDSIKAERFPT
jgi:hypothetical protein